jgi:hypothetical protein
LWLDRHALKSKSGRNAYSVFIKPVAIQDAFLPQKNTKIAESFGLDLRSLSFLRSFAAIELLKML